MFTAVSAFAAGLALFVFGMTRLGARIQVLFTSRVREYIRYAVVKPVYGLITGVVATLLFQSSTTTTVLTVGMVSAGLIGFYHSLGIILGADMGTTFTVQLVVWKITNAAPLLMVAGGLMWMSGRRRLKLAGEPLFYFGLMLFGLGLTSAAAVPLKNNPTAIGFFQHSPNAAWGIVLGAAFTALVHASAIPISMLVILAQQDLIGLNAALPIVLGANIGTTITALLAGITGNVNGRRTALSHLLFKSAGVVICLPLLPVFEPFLAMITDSVAQQIALGHLLFNAVIAAVFIFLVKPVSRLLETMVPGKGEMLPMWPVYLNKGCLADAADALGCAQKELRRQLAIARTMYEKAIGLFSRFDRGTSRDISYMEIVEDNLRSEIIGYLCEVSGREFPPSSSDRLFAYTSMADDIERIADHVVLLRNLCAEMNRKHTEFTPWGRDEMREIEGLIKENLDDALALVEDGEIGRTADIHRREALVDELVKQAREKHLERFHRRVCRAEAGPIFLEMLINLERISDHCENIAEYAEILETAPAT
jgi:phosphate:Na+ symporter